MGEGAAVESSGGAMLLPPGYPPPTAERGRSLPSAPGALARPGAAAARREEPPPRRAGPRRAGVYKLTPGTRAEPHIKGRVPYRLPSLLARARLTSPRAAGGGVTWRSGAGRRSARAADWAMSAGRLGPVRPEAASGGARPWGRGAARPACGWAAGALLPKGPACGANGSSQAAVGEEPR